jgi:hypothetical protein
MGQPKSQLGHPAPLVAEFEQVIMIAVGDRRDGWVGPSFLTLTIRSKPRLEGQTIHESEMALSCWSVLNKRLTPPTLLKRDITPTTSGLWAGRFRVAGALA